MGADGTGNFDNDEAVDWIGDLREEPDAELVASALRAALADAYVETGVGCEALAAAEVVAAALGRPGDDEDAEELGAEIPEAAAHAELARRAVQRVRASQGSSLYELWDDAALLNEWLGVVDELLARLTPASS